MAGVIASAVKVVEIESCTNALAGVDAELGSKMVLTVSAVAGIVVGEVGERRQRIGEVELINGSDYVIVRLREDKLLA